MKSSIKMLKGQGKWELRIDFGIVEFSVTLTCKIIVKWWESKLKWLVSKKNSGEETRDQVYEQLFWDVL